MDTSNVTRFEVIDWRADRVGQQGRALVAYDVQVELSIQDDGKTLKVFMLDPDKEED